MSIPTDLKRLRRVGGMTLTTGLDDPTIEKFAQRDERLAQALDEALHEGERLEAEYPELWAADEAVQRRELQADYLNFYEDNVVQPFVALAARGPWVVTTKGAVIYDCGGYGMLGLGHAPASVLRGMGKPHVMANVMTPGFSQFRFAQALAAEIGHRRAGGFPFHRILCLNSGSEVMSVAGRLADANAHRMTSHGGPREGAAIRRLALARGFHGRTDLPARYSDSTRRVYEAHLASFHGADGLTTVEPNDLSQLEAVFARAESDNTFFEALFMEPVMGEGNPGMALDPDFYALARELTRKHGTLLLVDSIQAGLRARGVLSIVDYPGFENLDAPDMESYSKALNAGQYPLSVLAMNSSTTALYRKGLYGNTMSANPRALDVGFAVLSRIAPELRRNIVARGRELVDRLQELQSEPRCGITGVQGTGLLVAIELDPAHHKGYGDSSIEEHMRRNGVNVIHGGANSLRYTPPFDVTTDEVDLIVKTTRRALVDGPRRNATAVARD